MLKGVYFDFGGVIGYPRPHLERKYFYLNWDGLDTLWADKLITRHLRAGVGRKDLEEFFKRELYDVFVAHEQTDLIDPQSGRLLLQRLPLIFDCPMTSAFVDQILDHLNTMPYIEVDPRAAPLLRQLRLRGLRLSMISNMLLPGRLLIEKLRAAALLEYFETITISSEAGFIKPHREIFLRTLAKDGLDPAEVLFVGDTYRQDILGAKNAGLKTAWLNSRNGSRLIPPADLPDYALADLMDLLENL